MSGSAKSWPSIIFPFSDEEQSRIATIAVQELAWNEPEKAALWLVHVQPDEGAAEFFADIASRWALKDFKGVTAWLDKLLASPARTSAVLSFAETSAAVDPAAAADWALTAGAGRERESVLIGSSGTGMRAGPPQRERGSSKRLNSRQKNVSLCR